MKDILIFDELSKVLYEGNELKDGKNGDAVQYTVPAVFTPEELDALAIAILGKIKELNEMIIRDSPLMREAIKQEKIFLIGLHSKLCGLL